MNLKNVLIIVGVIALILLIIQYVGQVRRMRQGDNFVSRGRAFVNWLLLFIIRSSPKCWCKLNSANLSFHKLKHTGFF